MVAIGTILLLANLISKIVKDSLLMKWWVVLLAYGIEIVLYALIIGIIALVNKK